MELGSGEGAAQLNTLLGLTRAVYRNSSNEKRLGVFIKAWMYEALDMPDSVIHIAAGLFILIQETNFSHNGLRGLIRKCEKRFDAVPKETASQLAEYYGNLYGLN